MASLIFLIVTLFSQTLHAADINVGALEITAQESLEWDRENKTYIARGDAVAQKGDYIIKADVLTAYYEEPEDGKVRFTHITAIGAPHVVTGDDKIEARILTAYITDDQRLDRLEAKNDVFISTPGEKASSDLAQYKADTEIAELIGNVSLMQGPNILVGERAEINLRTNASKLFAHEEPNLPASQDTPKEQKRVRGVFYLDEPPAKP